MSLTPQQSCIKQPLCQGEAKPSWFEASRLSHASAQGLPAQWEEKLAPALCARTFSRHPPAPLPSSPLSRSFLSVLERVPAAWSWYLRLPLLRTFSAQLAASRVTSWGHTSDQPMWLPVIPTRRGCASRHMPRSACTSRAARDLQCPLNWAPGQERASLS